MSFTLEIEIDGLPKMTNTIRGHTKFTSRDAVKWKTITFLAVRHLAPKERLTRAKLTFTRCSSVSGDADGIISSFKYVQDGLVQAGIIVDDNLDVIGFPTYAWEKAKPNKGKIKIKVEELETTIQKETK